MRSPIFLIFIPVTAALIGFDCGGHQLNVTSVSLLTTGDCDLDIKTTNHSNAYIQLLQLSEYNYAEVKQCKVEIVRTIYHCGMHSHISLVRNGQAGFLEETHYERCMQMFRDGTINLGDGSQEGIIKGIKKNHTETYGLTFAGKLTHEGNCKGVTYTDPYGSWSDVVVQGTARITLKSSFVPVHLETGKIYLKSGTICELKNGYCIDPDDGYTFWEQMPTHSCDFHQYDVLYEGFSTKIQDNSSRETQPTVYSLVTQDITFALTTSKPQSICGYSLLQTEHPKLFILETTKGDVPKQRTGIPVDNLDIFTYVNSKFVYVEKHIRTQMTSLYYNVMRQKCELESEVLRNTLAFATLLPDEFAYRVMKGPGYMAVTAGEATHIVKCIPVTVTIRKTPECYIELPVTVRNASLFLTPKSRILTKFGTQRECTYELPTLYLIENTWVQFTPVPHVRRYAPQKLQPMTRINWEYLTPGSLAESGIYSKQDIDKLRDHIMFPAEKPALLNSVARGITGYTMGGNSPSMYDLLDEKTLNKIAQTTASKIWSGFVTFGSATAGVLGIFIVIRLIKLLIDTLIHGYALHSAYGWSLYLLCAVWSSLTHLFLHLAHKSAKEKEATTSTPGDPITETQTPTSTEDNATAPPEYTHNLRSAYNALNKRLDEIEQTPSNASEIRSYRRGEV